MKTTPVALEVESAAPAEAERRSLDEYVYLVGRPPLKEFLDFVAHHVPDGREIPRRPLIDEWNSAANRIRVLEAEEAGWADAPEIGALAPHLEPYRDAFLENPILQHSFSTLPIEIGVVELDRLVVYQKHINLEFAREVMSKLGTDPSDEDVFRACLPFDPPSTVAKWSRAGDDSYEFVSPSNDLRFLGPMMLAPDNITGRPHPGMLVGVLGLAVGFGTNLLNVIHAENRLVLNNGSHRAFALRQLGITHAPCLIQHVSSREELTLVGPSELKRFADRFLLHARPSVFKDYFDPRLRKTLLVRRQLRQVRVNFTVQESYLPAL